MQNEKVAETKYCKHCDSKFEITDKDLEFYEKISPCFASPSIEGDGGGVKKYSIPSPTLCPDCRQQRRLVWRNERKLYKRKCDATGEYIISMFSPDKKYKIYNQDFWWSDKWNPMDYGRDFDFNKSFFEQFRELQLEVPRFSVFQQGESEGSEYTNVASNNKNCYLIFSSNYNENCYYGVQNNNCNNCIDCLNVSKGENCYSLLNSRECYKCTNSMYLFNCSFCDYSSNLEGCNNCFLSSAIMNGEYYFLNEKLTKEKFLEKKEDYLKKYNHIELFNLMKNFLIKIPNKNYMGNNNEDSFGDYIFNCKSCFELYDGIDCENIKYSQVLIEAKDCMDYSYWGRNVENIYESQGIGYNCSNILFSSSCTSDNSNLIYCDLCSTGSSNCFGCIGLRSKSYCILNKQYTKEEYEILVPKIIEHMSIPHPNPLLPGEGEKVEWGEFFPSSISPFGYNETVAMEYFPLIREQTQNPPASTSFQLPPLSKGDKGGLFNWSSYEAPFPKVDKVIKASMLPENIADIPDDILNWAIECEVTKKPFRIIKQELEFYRKYNLPIPKKHPDQRHLDRMKLRNPRKLFDRKCDKCGIEMKTTYSQDREEIVYCEECYNKEVY